MEKVKQVGIWIRVSTEDQARGESPEHHERRARLYAEAKGWQVREVYHLEAVSGKSVMGHLEAERMLKDIKSNHISGLIFSKLARLARNTRELLDFADIFNDCNADLISLQEAIDTSTPAGRLFYTMIAAMAQWEREEIASRVAASVPIRAKLGKPLGGQAPFGYRWEGSTMIVDPNEAPVRKLMYELFIKHRRKKAVARMLNEAGHRTRSGSKFSDTTVDRLLRDSTAKGVRRANYAKSLGDGKNWILKPESEWVLTPVEAIISEELWAQCNAILDESRDTRRKPSKTPTHLFSGVLFCHCGQKMYAGYNYPKYVCHDCRNKIGTDDLEDIFVEQLKEFFSSPVDINSYLSQADERLEEKLGLLNALINEEQTVRQQMDMVYKLYLDQTISSTGFGERYMPLEERHKQIDEQIPELQAEIDYMKIQYLSSDQILHEARDLYSRWSEVAQEDKRTIVENVVEKITLGKEDISIQLAHVPSLSKMMVNRQHTDTGS